MRRQRLDWTRVLALLIVFLGIAYFYLNLFAPRFIPPLFRLGVIRRPVNYLLIGTDVTFNKETGKPISGMEGRADTILILHLDPVHQRLNILSIPRDSYVSIPNYGMSKINAANVYGGVNLIKQTITDFTSLSIDGYFEMSPQAIIDLVNLVGGVYLYVDKDMYYVDRAQNLYINLKQGWQKLSGEKAHNYLRFRYDPEGDFARISRQQRFLETLFITMARPVNLLKAPLAVILGVRNIKTDLSLKETIRFLNSVRMMGFRSMRTFTISGEATNLERVGAVWLPNKLELERVVREYF